MTRALIAAFKSRLALEAERHKLTPVELVAIGLQLASVNGPKAGLDRSRLHLCLDANASLVAELIGAGDAASALRDAQATLAELLPIGVGLGGAKPHQI